MLKDSISEYILSDIKNVNVKLWKELSCISKVSNKDDVKRLKHFVKNNKSNLGSMLYDELKSAVKEIAEDFEWVRSKDGLIIMEIEDWIENARLRLGKEYHLVFERCYEENTLEEIEKIDWQQVIVEPVRENYPACDLPEGYSFVVKDINYLRNTDSFEVILEVDKQYWGDVTPYQAQVEALTASVEGKTAELAEKDEQLAKKDEALAAANGLLAELEATYDEN